MKTIKELEARLCKKPCKHILCMLKRAKIQSLKEVLRLINKNKDWGNRAFNVEELKALIKGDKARIEG